jgi:hypothetical protein
MQAMGAAARAVYEAKYTPARNYAMLMSIYQEAIAAGSEATGGSRFGASAGGTA